MKVGIGYDNQKNSVLLGKKVAENAIKNGKIDRPVLVIAFCGGQVYHEEYFKGLQVVVGNQVPIIGGSAIGVITNKNLSYEGHTAGAAIIESKTIQYRVASADGLDKNEKLAGQKLAKKLSDSIDGRILLIFYDSIKHSPTETTPPVINASSPLIQGIEKTLKSNVPIIGGGVIGDYEFSQTKQFCGSYVDNQSVVGALLGGDFNPYFRIMHGCTPKDGIYHTITKIEGPVLYEVDGKSVVDMIDDQYGNKDWRSQVPVERLTIGVNYGEKFGNLKEKNFVNRLITGVLPNGEGIVLFEPDLKEGSKIMFMLRNNKMMIESAKKNSSELLEKIIANGEKPVFGLYIDCAGRAAKVSNALTEEASEVQNVFNQYNTPLLGFYSGVEVAPLLGKSRGLDWTGVLLVFAKGKM
ncbi:MAG: FIST N-terminal domain-containing protein [Desulfobacterales bacterium]